MFVKDILITSIWGSAVVIVSSALLTKGKATAGNLLLIFHIIIFGLGLALNQGWSNNPPSPEDSLMQNLTRFWIIVYFGVMLYFLIKIKNKK